MNVQHMSAEFTQQLNYAGALFQAAPRLAVSWWLLLVLRGLLPSAVVRSPLMPLTAPQTAKIRAGLEAAGIPLKVPPAA